jgi:hypothetical protein
MRATISWVLACLCFAFPASSATISALNVNLLGTASGSVAGVEFQNTSMGLNFRAPRDELQRDTEDSDFGETIYRPSNPIDVSFSIAGLAGSASFGRAEWLVSDFGGNFFLNVDPDADLVFPNYLATVFRQSETIGFSFDRSFASLNPVPISLSVPTVQTSLGLLSLTSWEPAGYFHLIETIDDPDASGPGQGPGMGNRPITPPGQGGGRGSPHPVPLPAPGLLLFAGLGLIAVVRRRSGEHAAA